MRLIVCGGRDFEDYPKLYEKLNWISRRRKITCIIQGEARGVDRLAKQWAEYVGVECLSFPANWDLYGNSAGPIRNKQMIDEGKPDAVVAFKGGRGTANMVFQAKQRGIYVEIVS
jgi:hypothetical protein